MDDIVLQNEDHQHVPGGINVHLKRRSRQLGFSRLAPTSTPSRASACKLIHASYMHIFITSSNMQEDDELASYWET